MSGQLRVLDDDDLPALLALLGTDRLANLFVASRVTTSGLSPQRLGCAVWGFWRDRELVAACHLGANLVPVGADPEALAAFIESIGPRRQVVSIMGAADVVADLHLGLAQRWHGWREVREFRAHQPLMMIDRSPAVAPDQRVKVMREDAYESYLTAAIAMYTEEVGISPLEPGGSYQRYVRSLLRAGRAMGALHQGRVWFKSDIGSVWDDACQVQGVWIDPALRGRGLAAAAMAQVVHLCRQRYPVVSLYVNDYNTPARRLYERVGFQTVGELATVLY